MNESEAKLYAAAPDLLAVCHELVESAEYWSEYDVPIGIVDRLNAAIAKARKPAMKVPDQFQWAEDDDGNFDTDAGHCFIPLDGAPVKNKMRFCIYCGRYIDMRSL